MKDLGVFCGTFNPIHWGHLLMAESARDQFKLEKVLLITSKNPPHRHTDLLEGELRHRLVEAACLENPFFEPSRLELDRQGPSYTVDTLREIKAGSREETRLNLIVGQDNVQYLTQWHESDILFEICRILVAPREHFSAETPSESGSAKFDLPAKARLEMIDCPHVDISSSIIRQRLRAGRSVLYHVPSVVNKTLVENGYYL